jgi:peptidoglycan/xylan/chitin deacetylase (PgdA/CDA1 family)
MANLTLWSRRLAKTFVASTVGPLLQGRTSLVIGYHCVVDSFDVSRRAMMPSMLVSRAMLERQLECLGRHYRFVSVDEIEGEAGRRARKPLAAVTFDDGYQGVYEHAFPLLRRLGIPATVFAVTDFVGTGQPLLHDRLYWLSSHLLPRWRDAASEVARRLTRAGVQGEDVHDIAAATADPMAFTRALITRLTYDELVRMVDRLQADMTTPARLPASAMPVTWDMLREMRRAGMTIGSHTRRHIRMTNEDRAVQKCEISGSRERLERELGEPAVHFAYPDGDFNGASVRLLAAAGYRSAYTACHHRDPYHSRLTVPRLILWEHSSIDILGRLSPSILRCQSGGVMTGRACSQFAHA